jgi:hypothetical protein
MRNLNRKKTCFSRNRFFVFIPLSFYYIQPQTIEPIIVKETIQYPEWMKMYFHDLLSNKPLIAIIGKANQIPVNNP